MYTTTFDSVPDPSTGQADASHVAEYARARLGGDNDAVMSFRGRVVASAPNEAAVPLFDVIGFTIARPVSRDGHVARMREVRLYVDADGSPMQQWLNPFTGATCDVVHDWLELGEVDVADHAPRRETWGADVTFVVEKSSLEAHPLDPARWRFESSGAVIVRHEFSRYTFSPGSAGCSFSQVLMVPWFPWMMMGQRPGSLVMHLGGHTLASGFVSLDPSVRSLVQATRPEFAFAPQGAVGRANRIDATPESPWSNYAREHRPRT